MKKRKICKLEIATLNTTLRAKHYKKHLSIAIEEKETRAIRKNAKMFEIPTTKKWSKLENSITYAKYYRATKLKHAHHKNKKVQYA